MVLMAFAAHTGQQESGATHQKVLGCDCSAPKLSVEKLHSKVTRELNREQKGTEKSTVNNGDERRQRGDFAPIQRWHYIHWTSNS